MLYHWLDVFAVSISSVLLPLLAVVMNCKYTRAAFALSFCFFAKANSREWQKRKQSLWCFLDEQLRCFFARCIMLRSDIYISYFRVVPVTVCRCSQDWVKLLTCLPCTIMKAAGHAQDITSDTNNRWKLDRHEHSRLGKQERCEDSWMHMGPHMFLWKSFLHHVRWA